MYKHIFILMKSFINTLYIYIFSIFLQHPHRGFETITATITGIIDHSDSLKNGGRYGHGDLQWMTAGKGIVHGEMFPLINDTTDNPCRFFQIWLNLPKKHKMVEPAFVMHWSENIPTLTTDNNSAKVKLWAGEFNGYKALKPTPNSWASDSNNEVGVIHVSINPGKSIEIPPCYNGKEINRMLYYIEGKSLQINDQKITQHSAITLHADSINTILTNTHTTEVTEVLILQGQYIYPCLYTCIHIYSLTYVYI